MLLMMGGSSAEEEAVKVDADEDLMWDFMSCEDVRATWLRARTATSSE